MSTRNLLSENTGDNIIEVTSAWMRENYIRLNKELFGGTLGPCSFYLFRHGEGSKRGNVFGWFRLEPKWEFETVGLRFDDGHTGWGVVKLKQNDQVLQWDPITRRNIFHYYTTPYIELSALHKWTEKAALSTLVHEMCHYYVEVVQCIYDKPHGKAFQEAARMVERNSGGLYSYERIMTSEEVSELGKSDLKVKQDAAVASKGIHVIVVEYMEPRDGIYPYGYNIPTPKNYQTQKALVIGRIGKHVKRAFDLVTTDPEIVSTFGNSKLDFFKYTTDFNRLFASIKFDSVTELTPEHDMGRLKKPVYVLIMKPIELDECEYMLAKNMKDLESMAGYLMYYHCGEGRYDRAEFLSYFEAYDPRIKSHKMSNPKEVTYWKAPTEDGVLPWCERVNYKRLYTRPQGKQQ